MQRICLSAVFLEERVPVTFGKARIWRDSERLKSHDENENRLANASGNQRI